MSSWPPPSSLTHTSTHSDTHFLNPSLPPHQRRQLAKHKGKKCATGAIKPGTSCHFVVSRTHSPHNKSSHAELCPSTLTETSSLETLPTLSHSRDAPTLPFRVTKRQNKSLNKCIFLGISHKGQREGSELCSPNYLVVVFSLSFFKINIEKNIFTGNFRKVKQKKHLTIKSHATAKIKVTT